MGLKEFFGKRANHKKAEKQVEPPSLSYKEMEHLLNSTAFYLFERHFSELIVNPPDYIVPAVWGGNGQGGLDPAQNEMHKVLAPVLEDIRRQIAECEAGSHGGQCIEYLLKSLVFYKMAYMVQYYMNRKGQAGDSKREKNTCCLADMEPAGMA